MDNKHIPKNLTLQQCHIRAFHNDQHRYECTWLPKPKSWSQKWQL